jgi:tetratricopeptide (TPR) repeat protein
VTSYSRPDVLRILQISARQLQAWERAELFPAQQIYSFQDLGQLRTLRALREESISAASIRDSILAMRSVAGMTNPLIEAGLVRTGTRLAFRCQGAIVDPIRRQFLFDFDRGEAELGSQDTGLLRLPASALPALQDQFLAAVQAEESGDKNRAIELYHGILQREPSYAPAYINLGTLHFHLRQFKRAEELYRRATELDPRYVLAFFDLGNVLDELQRPEESIAAYLQAVALSPRYADAHYNLALAFERKGEPRAALRHWRAYVRLDKYGPWADHARSQIRRLLDGEGLALVWRSRLFIPPRQQQTQLTLIGGASLPIKGA